MATSNQRVFGEPRLHLKRYAKDQKLTVRAALDRLIQQISKADKQHAQMVHCLAAEHDVLTGLATHYFIDTSELAAFLEASAHRFNPQLLDLLLDVIPKDGSGVIHTTGAGRTAVVFKHFPPSPGDCGLLTWIIGGHFACYDPEDIDSASWEGHADQLRGANLIYGLALYLSCFPEALRDGLPVFAKHPAHFRGKTCKTVAAVPQVIDRDGPTPHFRKGHFRTLRSSRYVNKRWQVVWVSEAFIKGQAKTVEDVR